MRKAIHWGDNCETTSTSMNSRPNCAGDGQTAPCKTRGTPSRGEKRKKVITGLFSLFWQPQRPPMATKGERGDVPAPWGAWLAFGVAMVCSGGLPAVVWAGNCCCAERGPAVASSGPLWCPWGNNPRPLQWPPDPQGPWQRPPVGWGWYGAVCRACECRNAHSKWPPHGPLFFFLAGP